MSAIYVTFVGYGYYSTPSPRAGEHFRVLLTPALLGALQVYHIRVRERLTKLSKVAFDAGLMDRALIETLHEGHMIADSLLCGILEEIAEDERSQRMLSCRGLSEIDAVAYIRDAILPVFRPALLSWNSYRRFAAARTIELYFPGLQGEYQSRPYVSALSALLLDDLVRDWLSEDLSLEEFQLPAGADSWRKLVTHDLGICCRLALRGTDFMRVGFLWSLSSKGRLHRRVVGRLQLGHIPSERWDNDTSEEEGDDGGK